MTDITLEQRAATVPPTTAVTFVPAFSEAARMLGFAQATGSEDGVAYWGHIVAEYEAAAKEALRLSAGADWVLVPRVPTDEMLYYVVGASRGAEREAYAALIAAAPRHEPGEGS